MFQLTLDPFLTIEQNMNDKIVRVEKSTKVA